MRHAFSSALVALVFALPLVSGCSRPAEPGAEAAGSAAPAPAEPRAGSAGPAAQVSVPMSVAHAPAGVGGQGADASMPAEPIPQPAGGTSIAEVWANRVSLAGKTVTVRGKVVKFHAAIMNRNWLHLHDGTGKAADGTHDLTFTTDDVTKVGDTVTATGTVAVDKDFTAGYKYGVIVEGARLR